MIAQDTPTAAFLRENKTTQPQKNHQKGDPYKRGRSFLPSVDPPQNSFVWTNWTTFQFQMCLRYFIIIPIMLLERLHAFHLIFPY